MKTTNDKEAKTRLLAACNKTQQKRYDDLKKYILNHAIKIGIQYNENPNLKFQQAQAFKLIVQKVNK